MSPRYFANMKANADVPSSAKYAAGSIRSSADTEASDSSVDHKDLKQQRRRSGSHLRPSLQHSRNSDRIKGRLLARESGFCLCKTDLCLNLLPKSKSRYSLWQRDRIDIAVSAVPGEKYLTHYAGGTRVYVTSGDGSNFVVQNSQGMPAIKCCGGGTGDRKMTIIYGTRPLSAGNKASAREGATNFYPWYQMRLLNDGTVSLELYNKNSSSSKNTSSIQHQSLWFSEETVESESITIKSTADESVAATICTGKTKECQVTIAPSVDPAVMMCVAILISNMAQS